jgi:hypothetical protein
VGTLRASATFLLKIESLRLRAQLLAKLRPMVGLKPHQDIKPAQWQVLESQLTAVSNRLLNSLRARTDKYLPEAHRPEVARVLIDGLGSLEVDLSNAYTFYDTFMDILTQRLSDDVGPLLLGCDAIAADAMNREFIGQTTVPPLVYCDRGFGAATVREGVFLQKNVPNPVPIISIPYARISEKYNLISIQHEVGHQALVKLNLVEQLRSLLREALRRAGAPELIQELFARWSSEIGPDFWAFCLSGMAQTSSIRDVLILPQSLMFNISGLHPHPPAYLRFLLSVEWCRQVWGTGDWDGWATEWQALYSPDQLDEPTRATILAAQRYLPVVAQALLKTRFRKLRGLPLASLFDIESLRPDKLHRLVQGLQQGLGVKSRQPPGVQLAVFRLARENRVLPTTQIDALMHEWLRNLK